MRSGRLFGRDLEGSGPVSEVLAQSTERISSFMKPMRLESPDFRMPKFIKRLTNRYAARVDGHYTCICGKLKPLVRRNGYFEPQKAPNK